MDEKLTETLRAWLHAPAEARDWQQGVNMLLRLSGNKIEYRNLMRRPGTRTAYIEQRLQGYLKFRLARLTRDQVATMEKKVEKITARHALDKKEQETPARKTGKRDDHDSLPDEIKALYEENFALLAAMREVHLKLRMLSGREAVCPDADRYPFLKELIRMDKKLHANWKAYDTYTNE